MIIRMGQTIITVGFWKCEHTTDSGADIANSGEVNKYYDVECSHSSQTAVSIHPSTIEHYMQSPVVSAAKQNALHMLDKVTLPGKSS